MRIWLLTIQCVLPCDQRSCLLDASTTLINLPHESGRTRERHRVRLAVKQPSTR
jgi:hypothetical protein